MSSIQRVNHGRGHSYINTTTGQKVRGVTTILDKGIPKPALMNWAVSTTIDYATDNWADLTAKAPSVRAKELGGARYAAKDAAAGRGTLVHRLAEQLVLGEKVAVPDEIKGYVEAYVRFLDDFQVAPVLVETTVYSAEHQYCGTLDLIADLLDHDHERGCSRWLLDVKTTRSGIFGETALQLAGYRYADVYLDGDADVPMLDVERTGAVWVRADGYDLIPVEAGPVQHRQLLYAAQVAEFVEHSRDLVGVPVISPNTSTYRLERADDDPRF